MDFLQIFETEGFMPHGMCYLWEPGVLWLHVVSDFLTGTSYWAISFILVYLVWRAGRQEAEHAPGLKRLPYPALFLAFGLFIVACGTVHLFEVWVTWNPDYWAEGIAKAFTAVASVGTAVALPPLVPRVLRLLREARLSEERQAGLVRAHEELREAHRRVKEYDELKTQFFANVSHELRTPITLILGPVDGLLASPGLDTELRRQLETVARNARLLGRHVDDLLEVSRLEAGRASADYRSVDLAALVRLTVSNFESVAEQRRMELVVATPESLPAEVDPDKVQRILLNLLSNAFKFTPEDGTVRVVLTGAEGAGALGPTGRPAPGTARLEVRDSGPGIPPEQRQVVFERFRQLDAGPTRRYAGTGLGLAIAKEFAELHGGRVSVDDAPEGGARFVVELPVRAPEGVPVRAAEAEVAAPPAGPQGERPAAPPPAEAPEAEEISPEVPAGAAEADVEARREAVRREGKAEAAGEAARREAEAEAPGEAARSAPAGAPGEEDPARVLVVEDNDELRRFLVDNLGVRFRVTAARDGEEALRAIERETPDLVLTDIMMPRLSGDELVRRIRRNPALARVPVVVLTAKADDELRIRLLREGAQDYLIKPFSTEELRLRVGTLVAAKRTGDLLRRELESTTQSIEALARELVDKHRSLAQAMEEAARARVQAEAANQAKSNFLSVVSHELRTPLNAILGYIDLLSQGIGGALSEAQRNFLDRINENTRHLRSLIEEILSYARTRAERPELVIERTDVAGIVRRAATLIEGQALEKGIELRVSVPAEPLLVETDPGKLRLILMNLLSNAVRFTERGRIELLVEERDGRVELAVRDTGVGIRPEDRERIFDPFWQAQEIETRAHGGTGLGLSLARDLARHLGGDITVESEPGRGSTFTVTLPAASPADRRG